MQEKSTSIEGMTDSEVYDALIKEFSNWSKNKNKSSDDSWGGLWKELESRGYVFRVEQKEDTEAYYIVFSAYKQKVVGIWRTEELLDGKSIIVGKDSKGKQ